jgi:hypothetical protein
LKDGCTKGYRLIKNENKIDVKKHPPSLKPSTFADKDTLLKSGVMRKGISTFPFLSKPIYTSHLIVESCLG